MKLIITIVLTFAVAVGLALVSMDDPGYIVLTRDPYVVRMPLLLFVLFLFVGFVLLYLLINFVVGVFRAPKKLDQWKTRSGENAAQKHTMLGYAGLIEGNWSKAEQSLLKNLQYNRAPLLNFLGAAYAAHQQGNIDRRNRYLDDALQDHPAQELSINLTRARLLFQGGEYSASRDCLESLRKSAPKNAAVVRLLSDVYKELEDWPSLLSVLSAGKKLKAFGEDELSDREQLAYQNMVESPALLQSHAGQASNSWDSLPKSKRKDPQMIAALARQLIASGDHKQAEKELRTALNRKFDDELILIYGSVNSPFLEYQIQLAESFEKKHPQNGNLLYALARFHQYANDYKKSLGYYENALENGAPNQANLHYAELLEQTGDKDRALLYMKKGSAALASKGEGVVRSPAAQGELVVVDQNVKDDIKDVMPVVR